MTLRIYNNLTKKVEDFKPINPPFVGMYVCGPTVYGETHLGHARTYLTFDLLYRYLIHLGYKVRYVRNITDVGHLVNDLDEGEDKIAKKAKIEQLEPMEIAQQYSDEFYNQLALLNIKRPSIEPRASGHILEQIEMIEKIIQKGLAYVSNGSVYFDVIQYSKQENYGILSGRAIEDMLNGASSRELEGQSEKRNPNDFALWKKASAEHIMQWNSPWGLGFPGWHIECSAMSNKYLGKQFDIHGGGMDLVFPHHEAEIAQSNACNHTIPAKLWIHSNMLTVNGQKMAKSLNNGIALKELWSGENSLLQKSYSPAVLRFFMLQAHYRSTFDFSTEALDASEKGYFRLMNAIDLLNKIGISNQSTFDVKKWVLDSYETINDDLNSPKLLAYLFDAVKFINSVNDGKEFINQEDLEILKTNINSFVFDILGLEKTNQENSEKLNKAMDLLLNIRNEAKAAKDFVTSDRIRKELESSGFVIKDNKENSTWN